MFISQGVEYISVKLTPSLPLLMVSFSLSKLLESMNGIDPAPYTYISERKGPTMCGLPDSGIILLILLRPKFVHGI